MKAFNTGIKASKSSKYDWHLVKLFWHNFECPFQFHQKLILESMRHDCHICLRCASWALRYFKFHSPLILTSDIYGLFCDLLFVKKKRLSWMESKTLQLSRINGSWSFWSLWFFVCNVHSQNWLRLKVWPYFLQTWHFQLKKSHKHWFF